MNIKFRTIFTVCLMAFAGFVYAQADEKAGQQTKDLTTINAVLGGTPSMTGSLIGADTFDRRFLVTLDNGCNAASSDSSNDGTAFVAIPISSPTGATLVASLDNPGTDIGDTVLFLYCDPFDSVTPEANLVAWDDDGGTGFLSAFDGSEGIILAPDTTYFLVITSFSTGTVDGGNFEVTVGGLNPGEEVVFGTPVLLPAPPSVPALNIWGLLGMALVLLVIGSLLVRRSRS